MERNKKLTRKICFWGTGTICQEILKAHPEVQPSLFIDSNPSVDSIKSIPVIRPQEVQSWADYYIVVTTKAYSEISCFLTEAGLNEGADFDSYVSFFELEKHNTSESLKKIQEYVSVHPEIRSCTLLAGPTFLARQSEHIINFWASYIRAHKDETFVFISRTSMQTQQYAEKMVGCFFIDLPEVCNYVGKRRESIDLAAEEQIVDRNRLNESDEQMINDMENQLVSENKDEAITFSRIIMSYYIGLFDVLKPQKMVVCSDVIREYMVSAYLCEKNGIDYVYWDYGWIPGTLFFDHKGIAGRSKLSKEPAVYSLLNNKYSLDDIHYIFNEIIKQRIDSGVFKDTKNDIEQLKKLNRDRKTVFLVGQGIENLVDGKSVFWRDGISPEYDSMESILEHLYRVCKSEGLNLIYKPHPGTINRDNLGDKYEDIALIRDMEINKLVKMSDVVVSLYSAVECNAMMLGKPVVQVGMSLLDKANCTYLALKKNELANAVEQAIDNGFTSTQQKAFLEHAGKLLTNCLWKYRLDVSVEYGREVSESFFSIR